MEIRPTDQTLAVQCKINDREIEKRKEQLNFTEADAELLMAVGPYITGTLEEFIEVFYANQIKFPDIVLLIGDAETLSRLKGFLKRYVLELFEGFYDDEYVNKRLRIGKVHRRIGVEPKHYIASVSILHHLIDLEIEDYAKNLKDQTVLAKTKLALSKLLMFDMQLVVDAYVAGLVSEVNSAKQETEDYAESLEQTILERTQQLAEMSRKDQLTNLFNRRGFRDHLHRELASSERYKEPLTLLYFDLNGFKQVNDEWGHSSGDSVLTLVGNVTSETIRENDIACRYGGDEFVVIMPRTDSDAGETLAQRLVDTFKNTGEKRVTFSIGLASTGPMMFDDADTLIRRADTLMYQAKELAHEKPGFHIATEVKTVDQV